MRRCLALLLTTLALFILFSPRAAWADEEAPPSPCVVEPRAGITQEDADAIEEVVCAEIRNKAGDRGPFRVRVARLGGKVVLTLIGNGTEKQLVLSGLDEVPVAAPRLVDAIIDRKSVTETQTVTNVVGIEARTPKKKVSSFHVELGTLAAATLVGDAGAGMHMTITAGSDRLSFVSDLRLAGYAFGAPASVALTVFTLGGVTPEPDEDGFSYASLSGGLRYHFSSLENAFFVGGGIGYDHLKADDHALSNGGPAAYGEVGIDFLRTNAIGGIIAAHLDAPAFAVKTADALESNPSGYGTHYRRSSNWTPIASLNLSFRF